MAISYNGLWKLLIDNNMNKTDLIKDIKRIRNRGGHYERNYRT